MPFLRIYSSPVLSDQSLLLLSSVCVQLHHLLWHCQSAWQKESNCGQALWRYRGKVEEKGKNLLAATDNSLLACVRFHLRTYAHTFALWQYVHDWPHVCVFMPKHVRRTLCANWLPGRSESRGNVRTERPHFTQQILGERWMFPLECKLFSGDFQWKRVGV